MRYLRSADIEYEKIKSEMQNMLEKEVWSALQLYNNQQYANDPWLWDLNWKAASQRHVCKLQCFTVFLQSNPADKINDRKPA